MPDRKHVSDDRGDAGQQAHEGLDVPELQARRQIVEPDGGDDACREQPLAQIYDGGKQAGFPPQDAKDVGCAGIAAAVVAHVDPIEPLAHPHAARYRPGTIAQHQYDRKR